MRRRALLAALLASTAIALSPLASGQKPPPVGEMKSLGNDRFQIGRIVVDKRAGRFTVPGRVHVMQKPLEYLATSPKGLKEYETLLELDATGSEFNLACILLGLERDPRQGPYQQFSRAPLVGPKVTITIAWSEDGKLRQVSAAEALLNPKGDVKPESVEWVYMGSHPQQPDRPYAADVAGTLVGFVHDANSIIEASGAIGVGAYGSVSGNPALLPRIGTTIEMIVELPRPAK